MKRPGQSKTPSEAVLVVDGDIVSRHAISDYLRHCGYAVVEAANTDEAMLALAEPTLGIDVIFCDMAAIGTPSGFKLAQWVRAQRPGLEVRLAGNADVAAKEAAALCAVGPHLARPYEPQAVMDYINQLRSARDRANSVFQTASIIERGEVRRFARPARRPSDRI